MIYGLVEIFAIGLYLFVGWKMGWSKAPRDEKCCTVIRKTYEIRDVGEDEGENESAADIEDGANDDDEVETPEEDDKDKSSDEVKGLADTEETDSTFDTVTNAESLEAEGGSRGQGIEMSLRA